MAGLLPHNGLAKKGIEDLSFLLAHFAPGGPKASLIPDFTLARGLNYYTGIIFEVKALGVQIGSIGGGGRYDDLTGLFGVPGIAGVGISFGVDRIYDVMEALNLFPESVSGGTQVLFFNLGANECLAAYKAMRAARAAGISCEIYPEAGKMDKQFKYAERKNAALVVIIGANELASGSCNVKDLKKGTQQSVPIENLNNYLLQAMA
jgi:histidyl-tRNA synthetase